LDDELNFGKFRGFTILQLIETEPSYLRWAMEQKIIELDNEAFRSFQEQINGDGDES
jgi:hypothetical protein